jgi:hypothetical protein
LKTYLIKDENEVGLGLNALAREQMKLKLLQDIRQDIEVCRIENIDYREYLLQLKEIIDGFLRKSRA